MNNPKSIFTVPGSVKSNTIPRKPSIPPTAAPLPQSHIGRSDSSCPSLLPPIPPPNGQPALAQNCKATKPVLTRSIGTTAAGGSTAAEIELRKKPQSFVVRTIQIHGVFIASLYCLSLAVYGPKASLPEPEKLENLIQGSNT